MESREFLWSYWNLIKDASDTKIALMEFFSKSYELTQLQVLVMGQVDSLEDPPFAPSPSPCTGITATFPRSVPCWKKKASFTVSVPMWTAVS